MSIILDRLLVQAIDESQKTVTLSPGSVAVLLFATGWLSMKSSWLDLSSDPLDDISDADWEEIEALVGNLTWEVFHPMLGYIFPLATELPDNCLLCDGATYAKADYPALYAVLDPVFIVDTDNFTVPDLRSRTVVGAAETGSLTHYEPGDEGGAETVTLTTAEMPAHSHGLFEFTALAVEPGELPVLDPNPLALRSSDSAGGGGAHENRQPFTALVYAIVAL